MCGGGGGRWKAGSRTRRERPKIPEESLWRKTRKQTYKNNDVRRSTDTQQVYANTEQHHNQHMQYAPEINRGQMGGGGRGTPGVIPLAGKGHVMQQRLVGRELDLHKDARCKLGQKHLCPKFFRLFVQKL